MGLKAFKKSQFAVETVHGDGATPDHHLVGTLGWHPELTWHEPDEDSGLLSRFVRRTKLDDRSMFRYEGSATFEQIAHWLGMAVKGGVTPAANVWTFLPNLAATNNPDTISVYCGDDSQVYKAHYLMCTNFELSMAMGEVAMVRADLVGHPLATHTAFEVISLPTVEDIVAHKAALWVDSTWAGLGGTSKPALLMGANIRLATGVTPVKYADATDHFSAFSEVKRSLEVELQFRHVAESVAEFAFVGPGTKRFVRLKILGSGTKYLQLDMCGTYREWPDMTEKDGEMIVSTKMQSEYDQTSAKEFSFEVKDV